MSASVAFALARLETQSARVSAHVSASAAKPGCFAETRASASDASALASANSAVAQATVSARAHAR